ATAAGGVVDRHVADAFDGADGGADARRSDPNARLTHDRTFIREGRHRRCETESKAGSETGCQKAKRHASGQTSGHATGSLLDIRGCNIGLLRGIREERFVLFFTLIQRLKFTLVT